MIVSELMLLSIIDSKVKDKTVLAERVKEDTRDLVAALKASLQKSKTKG
jgi:non-homologous end joining protein Ku